MLDEISCKSQSGPLNPTKFRLSLIRFILSKCQQEYLPMFMSICNGQRAQPVYDLISLLGEPQRHFRVTYHIFPRCVCMSHSWIGGLAHLRPRSHHSTAGHTRGHHSTLRSLRTTLRSIRPLLLTPCHFFCVSALYLQWSRRWD